MQTLYTLTSSCSPTSQLCWRMSGRPHLCHHHPAARLWLASTFGIGAGFSHIPPVQSSALPWAGPLGWPLSLISTRTFLQVSEGPSQKLPKQSPGMPKAAAIPAPPWGPTPGAARHGPGLSLPTAPQDSSVDTAGLWIPPLVALAQRSNKFPSAVSAPPARAPLPAITEMSPAMSPQHRHHSNMPEHSIGTHS